MARRPGSGGVDWIDHWRRLVEARHDQGRRLDRQHGRSDAWSGRASRFARFVRETGQEDPLRHRLLARVGPDTAVLDVGAGPGRHTIPLARAAGRVTAVEPSAAMRAQLEEALTDTGLTNVEIVPEEWPLARPDRGASTGSDYPTGDDGRAWDLVLCAHVLYPVVEVAPFLRALDAAARGSVYLALRLGQREGPYLDLFEQVWGEPRALAPDALDLFNVCHQLDLPASFELVPFPSWRSFDSFDEAAEQVRRDLLNPDGPAADRAIIAFLREHLVEREGRLGFPADAPRAGIISWSDE